MRELIFQETDCVISLWIVDILSQALCSSCKEKSNCGRDSHRSQKRKLTLGLEAHQRGVSWRVYTESETPERHLSVGCERNGQRCEVPAELRYPERNDQSYSITHLLIQSLPWTGSVPAVFQFWLTSVAVLQMCQTIWWVWFPGTAVNFSGDLW